MKLILDLEANGFDVKVIHCIVVKDVSTNIVYRYNPDNLEDALKILKQATLLILAILLLISIDCPQAHPMNSSNVKCLVIWLTKYDKNYDE